MSRKTKSVAAPLVRRRPANPPDLTTARGRFGAAVRAAREKAGVPVAVAAAQLRVGKIRWYQWESGRAMPPIYLLGALCDALGCEVGDLIPEGD